MKMTFSDFPGMFKNLAPAVKTNCKLKIIKKIKNIMGTVLTLIGRS